MAARVFSNYNFSPTLTGDTLALADNTYMAIKGGASTQVVNVTELYISGMAGTAAPMSLALARSSAIGVGVTSPLVAPCTDGPMNPNATALGSTVVVYTQTGTTGPNRSALVTLARLNMGINAFGGSYRWNASPTQKWLIIGNAASAGESTLSGLNVGGTVGAINCSIIYEPE